MHVVSSIMIIAAVPRELPRPLSGSWSSTTSTSEPLSSAHEEPPGHQALSARPFHTPPAHSSRISRAVTPKGSSYTPGLFTWPEMAHRKCPVEPFVPSDANHGAPFWM